MPATNKHGKTNPVAKVEWTLGTKETSQDHHPTFVVYCNEPKFNEYRKKPESIALVDVVEKYEVLVYDHPGKEGKLDRPNKELLKKYFQTANVDQVVEYVIKNGKLQHLHHSEAKVKATRH